MTSLIHQWWVNTDPAKPTRRRLTNDGRAEIVRLYKAGSTKAQISRLVGTSRETVKRIVVQAGLESYSGQSVTDCPVPQLPSIETNVPANCYCAWCERAQCSGMTPVEREAVLADYHQFAEALKTRNQLARDEAKRIEQERIEQNKANAAFNRIDQGRA